MTKPQRTLFRWGLLMVGDQGPILAGCEGIDISRTSTPLVEFNPETLTGVTASGRPYRLLGEPEPGYALMAFHSIWDAGDVNVHVVGPVEAAGLIRKNGNAPFQRAPEQQAALDRKKLEFLSAQFRRHLILNGIDEWEAALRAGLSANQLSGLLDADLSKVSADEADQAFVRLIEASHRFIRNDLTVPDASGEEEPTPAWAKP